MVYGDNTLMVLQLSTDVQAWELRQGLWQGLQAVCPRRIGRGCAEMLVTA
jgi:hypothetical protein